MINVTWDQANVFAVLALKGIQREFPNKITHLLNSTSDVRSPKSLHPAFYGCWDVHSSIHAHWLIVRVLHLFPNRELDFDIRRVLNENLSKNNILVELEYFDAPNRQAFERLYGWAWILKLQAEIESFVEKYPEDQDGIAWRANLKPLSQYIVKRFKSFLEKGTRPNRVGVHANTAFALRLAFDYAITTKSKSFLAVLHKSVEKFYSRDSDMHIIACLEPNEDDFLSPTLMEAALISRVRAAKKFSIWFSSFYRSLPPNVLKPVCVIDKKDPKLIHLDGLNLSRAWCLGDIARKLEKTDIGQVHTVLIEAAADHLKKGLENVASGEYVGEHWLATFAMLALS